MQALNDALRESRVGDADSFETRATNLGIKADISHVGATLTEIAVDEFLATARRIR